MIECVLPFNVRLYVAEHLGSTRKAIHYTPLETRGYEVGEARWDFTLSAKEEGTGKYTVGFEAKLCAGEAKEVAAGFALVDNEWSLDNYVLIPGAVYAGNRFVVRPHAYPPPPWGSKRGEDQALHTIDLPGLRQQGDSHLDQLSLDAAIPALCIYFPKREKALFMFTEQACAVGCFNYEVIENESRTSANILLGAPGIRHDRNFTIKYKGPTGYASPSTDVTADLREGQSIAFNFKLHWVDCSGMDAFYAHLFEHRKTCFDEVPLRKEIPYSAVFETIHKKQNQTNWHEALSLYQTSILGDGSNISPVLLFQSGWCGGVIVNYPLMQEGDRLTQERIMRHLDFYFTGMAPSGLFYSMFDGERWLGDHFDAMPESVDSWTLTRRVGDVLYFLLRLFLLMQERREEFQPKAHWQSLLRKNADAIVRVWRECGELGQYINLKTGAVEVSGTTSGALVPAALILASEYFEEPRYRKVALEIGKHYRDHDLANGLTTGAPGDAMRAPDSESVVALLESFILLYEHTGDDAWLSASMLAAWQASSWALSYDYRLPEGSALAQMQAQSRGAWLANAQNKTAVPGICTLSGQGFLRLYRATGDVRIMQFLREVSHTIPQYMGRKDKKIPCVYSGGNDFDFQPEGWICERVNVTHWGEPIGELFAYSTWCEVAMMLVCADLPGVYAEPDTGRIFDLDHVEAQWADDQRKALLIKNPTKFDAKVSLLVEDASMRAEALAINAAHQWVCVHVSSGESTCVEVAALF